MIFLQEEIPNIGRHSTSGMFYPCVFEYQQERGLQ
jgi:hypothetical protein